LVKPTKIKERCGKDKGNSYRRGYVVKKRVRLLFSQRANTKEILKGDKNCQDPVDQKNDMVPRSSICPSLDVEGVGVPRENDKGKVRLLLILKRGGGDVIQPLRVVVRSE